MNCVACLQQAHHLMSTVRSNGIFVHHFDMIPTSVEWCLVLRFRCAPFHCQMKCHPFLRLSLIENCIDTHPALAPSLSENDAADFFVNNICLLRCINKQFGCAHSSSRLEGRNRQLLRKGAIRIIRLSVILRGRGMVVREE